MWGLVITVCVIEIGNFRSQVPRSAEQASVLKEKQEKRDWKNLFIGLFLSEILDQRVRELIQQSEQRDKQRQDRLQQILIQTMNNAVASNMEKQVRQEMANTILPSMCCITE